MRLHETGEIVSGYAVARENGLAIGSRESLAVGVQRGDPQVDVRLHERFAIDGLAGRVRAAGGSEDGDGQARRADSELPAPKAGAEIEQECSQHTSMSLRVVPVIPNWPRGSAAEP